MNPYFKLEELHQAAAAAAQVAQQRPNTTSQANLYWPGIQGLIANPNLWRDRFNGRLLEPPSWLKLLHAVENHHHFHKLRAVSSEIVLCPTLVLNSKFWLE